ncbi:hypothetical protein FHL15_000372 [Xylaria flabelliformis]|uniref:Uncharacterized protein n=1 Tax=Xylaria flabelliformis TaxID=2512241 RepID=A0A553IFQ5_9PEZI|nr:hypothetical protein FHL15_000372 [Xylaria flabelliformis]
MDHSFDGHGLSREQLLAKAEAAAHARQVDSESSHDLVGPPQASRADKACEWRGDAPDPEIDDLAHACENNQNQQPSRPVEACDWRGDEPEHHQDDLGQICQPDNQAKQSDQRNEPAEEVDSVQMPIPRSSKVTGIPETRSYSPHDDVSANALVNNLPVLPPASDKTPDQKHGSQPVSGTPARDAKQTEQAKRPKREKAHAGNATAGPSNPPPKDHGAAKKYPTEGRTHSPWVDSLEQLPATVIEKLNNGVKETLEAAASVLTPIVQNDQKPAEAERTRKSSGLAPISAAPPPPDLYIPRPAQPLEGQIIEDDKKHQRERSRSEKKAQREAKRKARQEKIKEKREARRGEKEMRRKERQWKKTAKKGGELPLQLRQGLRFAPDSKVPYNSECDICTKAAASTMSSKKRDPKCTTCAKAAEHESTDQFLKSLKINLAELPSLDDLLSVIKKFLEKEKGTDGGAPTSDQAQLNVELLEHIAQHIRDFATNGGEVHLRGHKCNKNGQPGHLGRHGLDGNRDSPPTTDGEQTVSNPSRNSDSPTTSSPPPVDWWIRAMSSKELPSTAYRPSSPPRADTPLRRPKTTVYEAAPYSVPNRARQMIWKTGTFLHFRDLSHHFRRDTLLVREPPSGVQVGPKPSHQILLDLFKIESTIPGLGLGLSNLALAVQN